MPNEYAEVMSIVREFLEENKESVSKYGEHAIQKFLIQEAFSRVPIPQLPENATAAQIAHREVVLRNRAQAFEAASHEHYDRMDRDAKLRESAANAAVRLLNTGVSALFGIILGRI